MEELAIFRIFAYFPLAGLLLPDISSLLVQSSVYIPYSHIYIEAFLLLSIAICTAGIWYAESMQEIKDTPKSGSPSIQG
ncbi:hypothetical protein [Mucilaginibacter pineti]|nr:hypothetical protein [Mucilaginibacter pineti]